MSTILPIQISESTYYHIHRPFLNIHQQIQDNKKYQLITKIKVLTIQNNQLELKKQYLQNTIYDLKKLIMITNREDNEIMEHLHKQIKQIEERLQQHYAAISYKQTNVSHFQKCMLFWNQFM